MDPLDEHYTYVAQSKIPNSGQGLFARTFIPKGTTFTLYGGILITNNEGRDEFMITYKERQQLFNETLNITDFDELPTRYHISMKPCNTHAFITLHPEIGANSNYYNATMAHKANSKFLDINTHLGGFMDTPRYGLLPAFFSIEDIQKDEEILVNYGYHLKAGPPWYVKQYEVEKVEEKLSETERKEDPFGNVIFPTTRDEA